MRRIAFFNANTLKIIAAVTMLVDHAGVVLFPEYIIFRIIGRISFPIYAFMIAEGCKHTKNRLKHFLSVFGLGILCQSVFQITTGVEYMGILITFSASILLVNLLFDFKNQIFHGKWYGAVLSGILFVLLVILAYVITQNVAFDYGITGILLPVLISMPSLFVSELEKQGWVASIVRSNTARVLLVAVGLVSFAFAQKDAFYLYSLISVPLLLLYSGRRGRLKLKWFFYIFYPAHLVLLYGIDWIVQHLS